jgi:hypothetical protein
MHGPMNIKNGNENDEKYQLDATIMIYHHKYLYMFRASICPSSGVQVVYCCMWCSALGVVAVVLRSRCVVLCTVCESFIYDARSHIHQEIECRGKSCTFRNAIRSVRHVAGF